MKKLLSMLLLVAMCVSLFPAMVGSAAAVASAEMLPDPGMEEVATGWYSVESGWSYSTEDKMDGEKSIKATNTSVFATAKYELDKSKIYDFSIYAKGTGRVYLCVKFYDADNNAIANLADFGNANYGFSMFADTAANYTDWKKLSFSFSSLGALVPETAATFRIAVRTLDYSGNSGSGLVYYDNASLKAYEPGVALETEGNIIPMPTMGALGDLWAYTNAESDYSEYHSAPVSVKLKHDAAATSGDATILSEASDSIYKLDLNTLYEYSAWIKTDNCTNVTVRLSGNDRNKQATLADFNVTNEWKQYKTYFKPSEMGLTNAANKFKVVLSSRKGGATGNIWVDDVVLRKAKLVEEVEGELLPDPGMEQFKTGWYSVESGWEYTTAEKRTGEKAIKASSTSVFATPKLELDKSKIYDFSIYAKGTGRSYIYVKFYDKNNNALTNLANFGDASYGFVMHKDTAANYTDWKKIAFSFSSLGILVPETAATFRIAVRSLDNVFYYDDASLVAHDPGVTLNSDGNIVPNPTMGSEGDLWVYTNAEADYSEYHSAPVSVKLKHDASATSGDATVLSEESDSLYKLDLNKIYEYSVWLKTDNCTNVTVRLSGNDRNAQATLADFNVTNEWKQYKVYFKPSEVGLANAANKFKVVLSSRKGGTTGNIWVDDLILREANASDINLLQDPTFAKSLTWDGYWRLQRGEFIKNDGHTPDGCVRMGFVKSNGGTVAEDSVNLMGMKKGIASNSGKENYAVLDMNKEYELRFWAKKDGADDNSVINVLTGTADNEHAYSTVKVYPTTEWAEYKVLVNVGKVVDYWLNKDSSATEFYYTPYFSIWTADNFEGAVYIDDVTLHEVELGYADELSYVDTSVAKVSVSGNAVTGQVYFNGAAGDVSYIAAVYSGNILKDCAVVEETAAVGNNEFAMTLNRAVAAGDTVKLFVWSAEGGLAPIKASKSVNIK